MATLRGRVRWVAKWTGLLLCLTIIGVWMDTTQRTRRWSRAGPSGRITGIFLDAGCVAIMDLVFDAGFGIDAAVIRSESGPRRSPMRWTPSLGRWYVVVPLWIPFVTLGVPTAWLWLRGRGPRPGCCRCGYELTGLVTGAACPECGRRAVA